MTRQRHLGTSGDPALIKLAQTPPGRPVALLHSGRAHPRWASRSLLAGPTAHFRYHADRGSELLGLDRPLTGNCFDDLRSLLDDPTLPGKWFGYLSYELAHLIEPAKLGPPPVYRGWPLVDLAYCPDIETFEPIEPDPYLPDGIEPALSPADFTPDQYRAAVARVIEYIAAGDVFQVNLTQTLRAAYAGSPRDLYTRLAAVSPAWYGGYLESYDDAGLAPTRALVSTSPELFLQVTGRDVITRPIKGTRPADDPPDLLRDSLKDAAELNMIVDLMRNDLGRVCEYGSVRVSEPRAIETHPTVHHGVATVSGRLHPSMHIVDLLKATLPGGSITGAPKVRAMQIINELEPTPRGPYCGCIGYLSQDEARLNIAIRTMLLTRTTCPEDLEPTYAVDCGVGGGIVADSTPEDEYDETLTKARAMLTALGDGTIG